MDKTIELTEEETTLINKWLTQALYDLKHMKNYNESLKEDMEQTVRVIYQILEKIK